MCNPIRARELASHTDLRYLQIVTDVLADSFIAIHSLGRPNRIQLEIRSAEGVSGTEGVVGYADG